MQYKLTAKDDCHVWNTLRQHYLIKKGESVLANLTFEKEDKNIKILSIVILGIPTLFDYKDAVEYFDIKEMYDA